MIAIELNSIVELRWKYKPSHFPLLICQHKWIPLQRSSLIALCAKDRARIKFRHDIMMASKVVAFSVANMVAEVKSVAKSVAYMLAPRFGGCFSPFAPKIAMELNSIAIYVTISWWNAFCRHFHRKIVTN